MDRRTLYLVAVLFVLLTVAMTYPQVRVLTNGIAEHDDPLFSTWRLAWVAHQLPRDPPHLFDANIFHPEARTFAYSDAMIVPALAGAPLLWAGLPPILVHNLLLLTALALSGFCMFLL